MLDLVLLPPALAREVEVIDNPDPDRLVEPTIGGKLRRSGGPLVVSS